MIAAAQSGAGKTTVACGLAAALKARGTKIAPFKVGPDYIDPSHLKEASGAPCYNLDPWMTGEEGLFKSFALGAEGKDLALIEGVMGLYDGAPGGVGSTAQVAKILKAPVLLVMSARGLGQTLAALTKGLVDYDPELSFSGVVVTEVASLRQERMLLEAFRGLGLRCFGFLPRREDLRLPKRHLGLVMAQEMTPSFYEELGAFLGAHLSLEEIFSSAGMVSYPSRSPLTPVSRARIAVALDAAFCFYYQENLTLLEEAGARLVFFSPLGGELPEAQGYYFGGGYPELFAERLAEQNALKEGLRAAYRRGLPMLAECGGFMFLNRSLEVASKSYPMAGLLPGEVVQTERLKALGYRKLIPKAPNFLAESPLKGHEFRYSTLREPLSKGFEVLSAYGEPVATYGLVAENLFASYVHLHLGSLPEAAQNFVAYAASF